MQRNSFLGKEYYYIVKYNKIMYNSTEIIKYRFICYMTFDYILEARSIFMGFLHINFTRYTIEDLVGGEKLKKKGALELRKLVDILVIDDDEFTVGAKLEANNFRLTYKKDIENVRDLSEYPIILCDIRGVGTNLSSQYEGAFLIKEIKVNYPTKQVVAYTASQYDPSYNEYLAYADDIRKKDTEFEEWVEILDEEIEKCADPVYQWKRIRTRLLDEGVSLTEVTKLESAYVGAVKNRSFDSFEKLANSMCPQSTQFIKQLLSSIAIELIIKGIGI